MARRMRSSRIGLLVAVAVVPLVLWAALPMLSDGSPRSRAASIGSKIDQKREQIAAKKGRERVLSTTITRYSRSIDALQGDITVLQRKEVAIQGDLDAKLAELARIQEELRQERLRLARLRARLAEARGYWPTASSSSTRPTSPTSSPSCSSPKASPTCSSAPSSCSGSPTRTRGSSTASAPRGRGQAHRGAAGQARRAPDQDRQGDRASAATRSPGSRASSSTAATPTPARAPPSRTRSPARARPRQHLEGDLPRSCRRTRKIQAQLAAAQNGTAASSARPDPAGLRRDDLARQRPDRVAVRHALGPPARGRRHRGAGGHADPRRQVRPRDPPRLDRRLRQLHLRRPRRRGLDLLRAPVALRRPRWERA